MEKIKEVILNSLPSSAKCYIERILERLEEKGVDCFDDLKYIKFDEDFSDILKDVPARKLKKKMDTIFSANSNLQISTQMDSPIETLQTDKLELIDRTENNNRWFQDYKVSLKTFPHSIARKLKNNQCLEANEYRELVRLVVLDIMFVEEKPVKRQLEIIAKKFIEEYPIMQDKYDSVIIGSGYDGFLRKLIARVENVRRPLANSLKRKANKISVSDNYSCPNFLPNEVIDEKSLLEIKENLVKEYSSSKWDMSNINLLMDETFNLQRLDITKKIPIRTLKSEWPFLFVSKSMINHFNKLMKKDVVSEYSTIFEKKLPELYAFFEDTNLKKKIELDLNKINFLEVLCTYFEEDVNEIVHVFDKDESLIDVQAKIVPVTPFIAVFGNPLENTDNCALFIEKTEASEFINMKDASLLWFTSFYVLNLEYPPGCPATAEFIQRAFLGINPEKGTKSKKRSTRSKINVKVQNLIDKLCYYKSMWKD